MNSLIQEEKNHSESCIIVEVSGRTRKVKNYLANEGSGFALFSKDLEHNFRSNVGNVFGVVFTEKRPHKPEFAFHIVRIHSHDIHGSD